MTNVAEETLHKIRSNPNHTPLTFDPTSINIHHTHNHPHGFSMEYTNLLEQLIAPLVFPNDDIVYSTGYAPEYDFTINDIKYEIKTTTDPNQQIFIELGRQDGKDTGLTITEADFYVILHKTVNNNNHIIKIHVIATDTLKKCSAVAKSITKYKDNPAHGFNIPLCKTSIPAHCWVGDFHTPDTEEWDLSNCWRINTTFMTELQQMVNILERGDIPLKSTFKNVVTVKEM